MVRLSDLVNFQCSKLKKSSFREGRRVNVLLHTNLKLKIKDISIYTIMDDKEFDFFFFSEESVVLDSLKNALKMFSDLKIIDIYCVGNLRMVELHDHFEVKEKLIKYIELLEGLKG